MNRKTATAASNHPRTALRKILDTMEPEAGMMYGRKKEKYEVKYAILLSPSELDCIVKLCQKAVAQAKPKRV